MVRIKRSRPGNLSFTHKLFGEEEAELDVCEAGKSTPEDKIARWWIFGAMQIAAQFGNCQDGGIGELSVSDCRALLCFPVCCSRRSSVSVSATRGSASGVARLIMVIQKMRQLRMHSTAIRFTSRGAVRSLASSARAPDLRILWKVSIFQRNAYQFSFFYCLLA